MKTWIKSSFIFLPSNWQNYQYSNRAFTIVYFKSEFHGMWIISQFLKKKAFPLQHYRKYCGSSHWCCILPMKIQSFCFVLPQPGSVWTGYFNPVKGGLYCLLRLITFSFALTLSGNPTAVITGMANLVGSWSPTPVFLTLHGILWLLTSLFRFLAFYLLLSTEILESHSAQVAI